MRTNRRPRRSRGRRLVTWADGGGKVGQPDAGEPSGLSRVRRRFSVRHENEGRCGLSRSWRLRLRPQKLAAERFKVAEPMLDDRADDCRVKFAVLVDGNVAEADHPSHAVCDVG